VNIRREAGEDGHLVTVPGARLQGWSAASRWTRHPFRAIAPVVGGGSQVA